MPLEAQRLGLEAHASDLNPVAVLINKAMIEIPPRFAGRPPVNPAFRDLAASGADAARSTGKQRRGQARIGSEHWRGAQGLAEDVRFYGRWMREEAEQRIGHLYPKVEITPEMVRERPDLKQYEGRKLTVIAWLWARTVKSPNPAFADVDVPLVSTFMLSTKKGKEAYVEPVIEGRGYRFEVRVGAPPDVARAKRGTTVGKRQAFRCLMSDVPVGYEHIRGEGRAGGMGQRLMAIVAEGDRSRVYLSPPPEQEALAKEIRGAWSPDMPLPDNPRDFKTPNYGLETFGDLFTPRQLVGLTTFSDLVGEAMERVRSDATAAGLPGDGRPLRDGGTGATAYAEAVGVYLGLTVGRQANRCSTICLWNSAGEKTEQVFTRQAIPMMWDYSEANPLGNSSGNWLGQLSWPAKVLEAAPSGLAGNSTQGDARRWSPDEAAVISTDPPYYDNIGYADLSDFFYVWLRRSLKPGLTELFATLAVPKAEELVATPYRHGSRTQAEEFFLSGMSNAFRRLAEGAHSAFPVTIYYAFKQSETRTLAHGRAGLANTGWETFLEAVIGSGFAITGTWPMRTERTTGLKKTLNALASSIVLVCRPRSADAPLATRREFLTALRAELPQALSLLQTGNIAPVDLAQAAIGPGMRVYTRYARVLHASGETMTVREALTLINEVLDEVLEGQEGDLDAESRWALAWFEEYGFDKGDFGRAEDLSKAKNTSVGGMKEAGILGSTGGRVWLLRSSDMPADWDPLVDSRLVAWVALHHLVRGLDADGEQAAADLVRKLGSGMAEKARELCYRLFVLCERKKRAAEALAYNGLVRSWPEIKRLASRGPDPQQTDINGP